MIKKTIMRSCMVALVCLLHHGIATAQYNNNYPTGYTGSWASYLINGNTLDMVSTGPNLQCAMSEVTNLPAADGFQFWNNNLIHLKYLTSWGTTVWDKFYITRDSSYRLEPWRMARSHDSGYIVVGRAISTFTGQINPFAARFDSAGNYSWAKVYETNSSFFADERETSVCRIEDDPSSPESFIITRAGSAIDSSGFPGNVCVNALRIRGFDGALLWNKKYASAFQSPQDSALRSYPKTICHVQDPMGSYFFLSGVHLHYSGLPAADSSLFYMGIDKNGNVVRPYTLMHLGGSGPYNHDAVYDKSDQSIVMSFSLNHNQIPLDTASQSQIALMKFDNGMRPTSLRYYAARGYEKTNAARMTINTSDDAYVIAANIRENRNEPNHIAQLKVDKAGGVQHFNFYNRRSTTIANTILNIDQYTGDELYIIGGRKENFSITEERLLQTDQNGTACGNVRLNFVQDDLRFPETAYNYNVTNYNVEVPVPLLRLTVDIFEEDCIDTLADNFKQPQSMSAASATISEPKVYPTVLYPGSELLHIDADKMVMDGMTITLTSIEGRVIGNVRMTSHTQATKYDWQLPTLAPGYYVVTLRAANGELLTTQKVVRM